MDRTFLLPLVSLTALGSSGCGVFSPAIVGDWVGTSLTDSDGSFYNLPYTSTETYEGVTYTESSNFTLVAERDGSAIAGSYYQYSDSDGGSQRDEYLYAGDWEREDGAFELTFPPQADLDMSCTHDSGELECEVESGEVITFEQAED